ncbi:FADD protein, partial [Oxylabes madagascariensis]|nr:FADD protein [Oxylabes madagascariensis]
LDPFLSLLHSISSGLSAQDLFSMKFLCCDKIGKRRLDAVQSGWELFSILMEQQEITKDNLEGLKSLLRHVQRRDLLALVKQFEEGQPQAPDDEPDEHEKPVVVIGNYVGKEWKRLMRELGMPEVKLDRIEAAHPFQLDEKLFQGLREWQKWKGKDAKVADLIKALRGCNLTYVAEKVEE